MPVKESGKLAKWLKKPFRDRSTAASPAPSPAQSIVNVQTPEQEDVERITKASSDATELYAPSTPSAAADVQTTAGTDAGGKEPDHPAAAFTLEYTPKSPLSDDAQKHVVLSIEPRAEESQPAPDPTQQQSPALSTSQRLWNAAYDSLEKDTAELVGSYMKTLEEVLRSETPEPSAADISAELKDPAKRQIYMKELVEKGGAKISKASNITKGVGQVASFVLSAKGIIDLAIQNIPQAAPAALPWAGVCVGLQILRNPAQATKSNLAGITHVISRMDWYCALTEHLLNKDNIKIGNKSFEGILQQLERRVVSLYKALLLYQMKSICSYYRNQGLVFLRGLLNLDDWDNDLKEVTNAEAAVQNDSAQYVQDHTKTSLATLVQLAEGMETRLGDIRQTLQDFIALQTAMRTNDENIACLRALRVVDPQDDIARIENDKDRLLYAAYKWILHIDKYVAFTSWGESDLPPCRLLWIKGQAGTGKTMLLIGIIHELSDLPAALAPSLSYFFCQGTGTKKLSSATAALRSLIWMLLAQQPHLISHLQNVYNHSGAAVFNDGNEFYALKRVFKNILRDPGLSPAYLIVDALDECDQTKPGLEELMQLISTSLGLSEKVKWLLSSRPEVDVLAKLKDLDNDTLDTSETLVELDTQRLADPVNAYMNNKLTNLKGKRGYSDSVLAEVSKEVRQRAVNTFLWVALAFKTLETVHGCYAVDRIKEIPPGLSELYDHMMTRIENAKMIEPQDCKRVLVATALAYRPLSLSELAILADLPPDIMETAVEICGSFLTTRENTVNLIHQSAKDYLEKNYKSRLQLAGVAQGHVDISRRSIDAMSSMLVKNVYALPLGFKPKDIQLPDPDPLVPIRYSCVFWADHLFLNGESPECKTELIDDGRVFRFLKEYFLRLLESLSLLGKLSDGVQSIRKLLHIAQLQVGVSPQLIGFLKDAEKFVLNHGSIIERAPLQTYVSALIFSPMMSEVRNEQWKDTLSSIKVIAGIKDRWNAHQQTLEGHSDWVWAVAFSPDGKTLVSASDDCTIRLWDAATGVHQQTLKGHSNSVRAVAFSPDGKTLASASGDHTIRLWDAATGAHQQMLKGHDDWVWAVVFSSDGKTLASASGDHTIRLWDAATGAHQQTLKGHNDNVRIVVFSPDSKTLASASGDHTIWLWDAATGIYQQMLKGHSNSVWAVAFSPDGKTLASASGDHTIRLWDAATGAHQQTLKGHSTWVRTVVFSPDGKTLASASGDHTIWLWDVATCTHQQTLKGYSDSIWAVAFSPDSKTLASASGDHTIRLWDAATDAHQQTATGAHQQTLKGHSDSVRAITFSPDGKTLASASDDCTIQLWDAATGAHQQTLKGHSNRVRAVAFSPDGKMLASASHDRTIWLWDAATCTHQQTLKGHSDWVRVVAFSPDGKTLASASDDCTIRLWDVATGAHQQTLKGHSDWVRAVAFSPDGKMLASASDDRTIRLWDAATSVHQQTLEGHNDWVWAVTFSPDGKTLVSASCDHTIRLWDAVTSTHQQTIETNQVLFNLIFSEDGQYLKTAYGSLKLSLKSVSLSKYSEKKPDYTLFVDDEWVTLNRKNHLWLPKDYRATCVAVYGYIAVLGHRSGGLTFLQCVIS